MTRRKAVSNAQTKADVIDKIFSQVDAEVILVGALGAVASAGGIVGPFTKLMQTMSSFGGLGLADSLVDGASKVASETDWWNIAKVMSPISWVTGVPDFGKAASETITAASPLAWVLTGSATTAEEVSKQVQMRALMASGAIEAMIMMTLVKNPKTFEAIAGAVSSMGSSAAMLAKAL